MNGVNVGKTSYTDAFQRASFWTPIKKNGGTYHNKLKLVTLKPVKINLGSHSAILTSTCGPLGGVDINEFEPLLEQTIIPGLGQGVNPKTFVTFLMYNVVMYEGNTNNCCILGYHYGIGSPVQTYSPFEFDTTKAFGNSFTSPPTRSTNGRMTRWATMLLQHGDTLDKYRAVRATSKWETR
jgi:hypothetical protein